MRFLPNILTVFRIFLTPFFVFCLMHPSWQTYAIMIFVVAGLTDWYDGFLARKYKYDSDWGTFLDPLADKILVLAAFFSFAYLGLVQLWMVVVIVSRDVMVTYIRSYAMRRGKPMVTNILAKAKTASQMVMILIILSFVTLQSMMQQEATPHEYVRSGLTAILDWHLIYSGMLLVTLLTAYSGVFYLYQNRNTLRSLVDAMSVKDS